MKVYQVGESVRDLLLGFETHKTWVCIGFNMKYFIENKYIKIDNTSTVNPNNNEIYHLSETLLDYLKKCDLTINAMALNEELIDPFNGQSDLENGILRHVSNSFIDDPANVLKIASLSSKFGFTVHPETNELMKTMRNSVKTLTKSQIRSAKNKSNQEFYSYRFSEVLIDANLYDIISDKL